ncbi:MAG: hypothetical protein HDQ88_06935 [Clostridia bacterium]|nr:hypothetical protein [Clostridia bacterium]
MGYSNSPLVQYTKISPNKTTSNRKPIDRITIHHAAGNILVESMGEMFSRAAQRSSSNYGVGTNGKIAMYVEEAHSSWCSSSTANDTRAVTIEVANSSNNDSNWPVSDAALESTINLVADICKRNGKKKLVYFPDKDTALNYVLKSDEMLLTRHDFFKQKVCLPLDTEVKTPTGWVPLADIEIGDEIVVADFKDGDPHIGFYFSPVRDIVTPYKDDIYSNGIMSATKDHSIAVTMSREENEGIEKGVYMKTLEELMTVGQKIKKISAIVKHPDGENVEMILNQVVIPIDSIDEISPNSAVMTRTYEVEFKPSCIHCTGQDEVGCVTVDTGLFVIRPGRTCEVNGKLTEITCIVSNCPGPYLGGKFPYIVERVNAMLGSGGITVSGTITSGEPSSTGTGITDAIKANMRAGKLTDKSGTLIKVPDGLGTINTYMHWQKIKNDSLQKDLRTAAGMNFDANGYGVIDGRYVIAMTDTFGQVGDMVDICRDGSVLKGIIGDIKDQTTAHGTPANKWGHSDGKSIVEFIVDENVVKSQTHINETEPGKNKGAVLHVENKGNWFLNHQNDVVPANPTTPSTSSKFPYLVRVTDDALNIRQGPGTNYPVIGVIEDKGVYTILAESTGQGAKLWGQLKPVMGNGWISLGFTKPV